MKPSMLGLLIAAGAFGASTIYLGMQLKDERARADEVIEQSRQLSARIAELEKARADLESMRVAAGDSDPMSMSLPAPDDHQAMAASPAGNPASGHDEPERIGPRAQPLPRSEAMQKMMRTQLRMNFNRIHADLGEKLGLSKEQTSQLLNLLVDQQMALMDRGRQDRGSNLTPEQRAAALGRQQEQNLAEVAALIGTDKMETYQAYQESMPARQEVDMLASQLAAGDAGLSKDQRDRMVTALAEERKRVPAPKFSESTSREEFNRAMETWQEDYNQRAASRASSILNGDQQAAYAEYQQWSKEIRQQFEERRAARQGSGRPRAPATP